MSENLKVTGLLAVEKKALPFERKELSTIDSIENMFDMVHKVLGCDEMEKVVASAIFTSLAEIAIHYNAHKRKVANDPTAEQPYTIREFMEPILLELEERIDNANKAHESVEEFRERAATKH